MDTIKENAKYCLKCKNKPCQKACPFLNDIPKFIEHIKFEKYEEAFKVLSETTIFPSICGRICPHEKQCEGSCIRGIKGNPVSIGKLEAFIGDKFENEEYFLEEGIIKTNKKVSIIGGGPSGITLAYWLLKNGIQVTIYEKQEELGGVLRYGIPDFRLDNKYLDNVIKKLIKLGLKVIPNFDLKNNEDLDKIKGDSDAIYLSFGANISSEMNIDGEDLKNVYGANEVLEYKLRLNYKNKKIFVIGGGNVAIDMARTAKRNGAASVDILYRRTEKEMPASKSELEEAKKENINFVCQTNLIKILGDKEVDKLELVKTELVRKENEERLSPIDIDGSNYIVNADLCFIAVGSKVKKELTDELGIQINKWGNIEVDENNMTSLDGVFAGGDLVGEKGTVAWASRSGRNAAHSIMKWIK